jgi:hypothetical protein
LNYEYYGRYEFNNTYADLRTQIFENEERQLKQIQYIREIIKRRNCVLILSDRVEEVNFYEEKLKEFSPIKIIGETKDMSLPEFKQ